MGLNLNKKDTFHNTNTQSLTTQEAQIYRSYLKRLDSVSLYHSCTFFIELLAIRPSDQCVSTLEYLKEAFHALLFQVCEDETLLSVLKASSPVNIPYMSEVCSASEDISGIEERLTASKDFVEEEEDSFEDDNDFFEDDEESFGDDINFFEDDEESFGDDNDFFEDDEVSFGDDIDFFEDDEVSFGDDIDFFEDDEVSFGDDNDFFEDDKMSFEDDEESFELLDDDFKETWEEFCYE